MSNYRDDTQETIVIGDSLWSGSRAVADDVVRITAAVVFGMGAVTADALTISDEVLDRRIHVVSESVAISDGAPGAAHAAGVTLERARIVDAAPGRLRIVIEDTLTATDEVSDRLGSVLSDRFTIGDDVADARHASQLVEDGARVHDKAWQPARQLIEDHLLASAGSLDRLRARAMLADELGAADEVLDARASPSVVLTDAVQVADESWGALAARSVATDTVVIEDAVVPTGALQGQVWTAPTENWAMSRYAPTQAEQLAKINGVLHAVTAEGVFALDGDAETVSAEVRTGLLDIGQGQLALLDAAYVEYELDGATTMTVGRPQTGAMQHWTYTLPPELAGTLTNGRFNFGRGLRGRHFSFTLRLDGTRGYINDWQTLFAKSQRRI